MNAAEFHAWLTQPHPRPRQRPRPLVMGILNVTPDSFSDGGEFASPESALAQARRMIAEGADMLDIGGESTRPGAARVSADRQIARVGRVIEAIRRESDVAISVDTTLSTVAGAAVAAGAGVLNDISAGREDPAMFALAAARGLPIILMHMLGKPGTMQNNPVYADVTREVCEFLQQRARAAVQGGVPASHVLLDPGIGFGKTVEHNLQLLRDLPQLAQLGHRILVGTSRKRFIGTVIGVADPQQRIYGSVVSAVWSVLHGASIVRVHDVLPTVQALKMIETIVDK